MCMNTYTHNMCNQDMLMNIINMFKKHIFIMMLATSATLTSILLLIMLMKTPNMSNLNKSYSFECGFDPYHNPRTPFSLQFFKILMIFIMFDMEIIIIMPIPLLNNLYITNINTMIMIFIILIMGLYFEWKEGSLNWLK